MSTREVAELATRILAFVLFASSVIEIVSLIGMLLISIERTWNGDLFLANGDRWMSLCILAIPLGVRLSVIWFLWSRSDWIAAKIVPNSQTFSRWPRLRTQDLQAAAFSTVGLVLFCWGLRSLCGYATIVFNNLSDSITFADLIRSEAFVAALANVVIGIWLLLGSRGVVNVLRRLQRRDPSTEPTNPVDTESEDRQPSFSSENATPPPS